MVMTTRTGLRPEPTDSNTRPLLVSIKQASALLAISRSVIYQLMAAGQLTPIRIGRSVRLPVEQLERFVADRLVDVDLDG
ncbi:MAG: excisionase family DNA binding protein [Candidatus Azotimanducaceae bacterium]|jgi:excisionase family DNA binding protein